ncbi:hypothetical protein [Noviluteimonas dokdonensis]|uniref:hypothetical protein n=1 Tax=Noviluteimonas dokdonensis TaxID=414050 RepID=UPI001269FF7A|nr:hypothetical protein [Lysobacter dokdonensis]
MKKENQRGGSKNAKGEKAKQSGKRTKRARKNTVGTGRNKAKHPALRAEAIERVSKFQTICDIEDDNERLIAKRLFERTYVNSELRNNEPSLQATCWVAYRYMDSIERTKAFAQEYIAAYRRAHTHIDPEAAPRKRPVQPKLFENSRDVITNLYKARQEADRRGMPYDLFLDILMHGKVVNDKHKQPPLPNQLLSRKHSMARLTSHPTRDEISARLFLRSWDRRFFAVRSEDDPVQAAAIEELRADVLRADDPAGRLAKYLSVPGLIDEVRARVLFEGEVVDAAVVRATKTRRPAHDYDPADFRPACFGHRIIAKDSPCRDCPVTRACKAFRARVTGRSISATGSGDPLVARQRTQERDRKRKQRGREHVDPAGGTG